MNQLVADLASNESICTVLIHQWDEQMMEKAKEIKAEHLHPSARGKNGFIENEMKHADGQTRLCYWPNKMKALDLHSAVVKARHEEQKLII